MSKTPSTIADLLPDEHNARRRGMRANIMLEQSLREVGAARSIVIDEAGRVLAGNGTVEAATQAGITKLQVVDADGQTLVAVRRPGLSEAEKHRLSVLDNRTAELAEWDPEELAALAVDVDLTDLFTENELEIATGNVPEEMDPREMWEGMPDAEPVPRGFAEVRIGFPTEANLRRFEELTGLVIGQKKKFAWFPRPPADAEQDA